MSNENKLKLEDILIVQDYLDVFPDDLPGLPPKRRVEFIIDLVTRTTTTSMAPYRLTPMALKVLKVHDYYQKVLFCRPNYNGFKHL